MIVYNVTCNMEAALAKEWLHWMRTEHIPEVMATGCFKDYKILKLITNAADDAGVNYAIQYTAESMENYEMYKNDFAPVLQKKTAAKYGDSILAFRSLLEEIN